MRTILSVGSAVLISLTACTESELAQRQAEVGARCGEGDRTAPGDQVVAAREVEFQLLQARVRCALELEQPHLAPDAAPVAGRASIGAHDPVATSIYDEVDAGRLVLGTAGGVSVRVESGGRPVAGARVLKSLLELARQGVLKPHVYKRYPFEDLCYAFDDLVERRVIGRVVVEAG